MRRLLTAPAIGGCFGAVLLMAADFALLGGQANAETLVHLSRTVWGCVDPNEATSINEASNPARSDPRWLARTVADGQCISLAPVGQWATLSQDYNGLTYVGRRGSIGPAGSFWVPTTSLAIDAKPIAPAAPKPVSPQPEAPRLPKSQVTAKAPTESVPPPKPTPPVVSPVAVPQVPDTSPSTSAPQSSHEGGGGSTILVILAIILALGVFSRSKRKKTVTQRAGAKVENVRNQAKPASGIDFRIDPSSLADSQKRTSTENNRTIIPKSDFRIRSESMASAREVIAGSGKDARGTWHPPGASVSVAGTVISDGMVYVGPSSGSYGQHNGCLIDPKLPLGSSAVAEPLGYWPSYQGSSPNCRKRYLEWLGSGKRAADIDIGYVFLYFYGLERRLIVDTPPAAEIGALVRELQRLRSVYSANGSFNGYSSRLLEAMEFLGDVNNSDSPAFVPDLAAPTGDMPLSLKLAIARQVVADRPLGFELAASALFGLRDFWTNHRHVLDQGRLPFLKVLRARFGTAFPSGVVVRNRKDSQLQIIYRGATSGLYVDLTARAGLKDLPDPTTLTWTKLLALAEGVANELAPYAKMLAYYPARANSIAAQVNCPPELRDNIAVDNMRWLEALPTPASVQFGVLAKHAIGAENAKWTVRHRRQISDALAAVGHFMEPGPEDAIDRLSDDTIVQVVRGTNDGQSREMVVASAAAMLVASIAKANQEHGNKLEEFWLSQLPSRLSLSTARLARLRARLTWYRTNNVTMPRVKRMLGEATKEERELCAWSATVATGAIGTVGKPQIATLEAIHDALGIPRASLYTGLHIGLGAANTGAEEPVEVSDGAPEILHPIPRPPAVEPVVPDMDRLAKVRAETERVSVMLADIFTENEPAPEMPEPVGEGPLVALDSEHATLLTQLVVRNQWTRQEFENLAATVSLMPDGAMEAINEWAFDRYGDALIEDGDPVAVNLELLSEDLAAITATQ